MTGPWISAARSVAANRRVAASLVGSPRQHLREHGVVVRGDLGAVDVAGVDPHAVTGAEREPVESAGRGQVARVHVLGVEPGLDGVPAHRRVPRLGR